LTPDKGMGGELQLSWSGSCMGSDPDYIVYEGALGDFDSHVPRTCSTGGAMTYGLVPSYDNAYFIIVPRNASREGCHGEDSQGLERTAASTCLPHEVAECF